MAPIYVPPQPVPIIRQRIRNQADIQEQLRAYNPELQQTVGANAAAFEANNIGRKNVLYPEPVEPTEPAIGAKRPRMAAEELGREEAAEMFGAEAVAPDPAPVAEARFATPVPAKVMGAVGRPKGSKGKKKSIEELKAEIAASGSVPEDFGKLKYAELADIARKRGIDLMRR